jgi:hypothetical protein
MKSSNPLIYDETLVRPLQEAENEFLQVLLTEFNLKSKGKGFELTVKFDENSPTIWLRKAKTYLFKRLPSDRQAFYQKEFNELFKREKVNYDYSDNKFPFRFGNGGTLPIVRVGEIDYYCLFYRDILPIGWNIANGGANNLNELLRPDSIIERELREELIIVDPLQKKRYVFNWHDAHLKDHPDFALANRLWQEKFDRMKFPDLTEIPLPLKWIPASDIDHSDISAQNYDSVLVKYGKDIQIPTGYGFLNINGKDFGIEFDRVAKLEVGPNAIFCDGELIEGELLNQVIGLFEVKKFNDSFSSGELQFSPDLLFWNGQNRTGDNLEDVVKEYLEYRDRIEDGKSHSAISKNNKLAFNLCPVTYNLINRFLQIEHQTKQKNEIFDVFLSFASQDKQLAETVYNVLADDYRVFFSDITIHHGPFAQQIDHALDSAKAMVVVCSKMEHLFKSWVQFEWESFHNDILSEKKPKRTPFVAFIPDVDINDLPRPFRHRKAIRVKLSHIDEALERLRKYIDIP